MVRILPSKRQNKILGRFSSILCDVKVRYFINQSGGPLRRVIRSETMAKQLWKERWQHVRSLSRGGQGTTNIVRRAGRDDSVDFVLKLLNKPRDPDRRARMRREVAILEKFQSDGIPKIVDEFAGDKGESWFVMEYIPGYTLEESIRKVRTFDLKEALRLTEVLVETLASCHAEGVLHRDIKPDNIILRNSDRGRPVLIDFGLATEPPSEQRVGATGTDQQLGNRFLGLPELQTPGADKRDARSDLTMCCGILLYSITGEQPMTLVDELGRAPHQRDSAQPALSRIERGQLVRIAGLLDRGFASRIDARWQTIVDLRKALRGVRDDIPVADVKPPAEIRSIWTLHLVEGRADSLYTHHVLSKGDDLEHFFDGNRAPLPLTGLGSDAREAASVLWSEIKGRADISQHIPHRNPYRHAFDHVSRFISSSLAKDQRRDPTSITWNRELNRPTGRINGSPKIEVGIRDLSAASQAAIAILDATTLELARKAYEEATKKREDWG